MATDNRKNRRQRLAGGSKNSNTNVNNAGNTGIIKGRSGRNAGPTLSFTDSPRILDSTSGRNKNTLATPTRVQALPKSELRSRLDRELYFQDRELDAGKELQKRQSISNLAKNNQIDSLGKGQSERLPSNFKPIDSELSDVSPSFRKRNEVIDTDTAFSNAATIDAYSPEASVNRAGFYSDNRVDNEDGTSTITIPGKGVFTSSKGDIDSMISRMSESKGLDYARDPDTGNVATLSDGRASVTSPSGKGTDEVFKNSVNSRIMEAYDNGDISLDEARQHLGRLSGNQPTTSYAQNSPVFTSNRSSALSQLQNKLIDQAGKLTSLRSPSKAFDRAAGNRMINQALGIEDTFNKADSNVIQNAGNIRNNQTSRDNNLRTNRNAELTRQSKVQSESLKRKEDVAKRKLPDAKAIRSLVYTKGPGGDDTLTDLHSRESSYNTAKRGEGDKDLAMQMFPEVFDNSLNFKKRESNLLSLKGLTEDTKLELYKLL